jgi:hypothetical protein
VRRIGWLRSSVAQFTRPGGECPEPPDAIGLGELLLDEVDAVLACLHRAMTQHQVRESRRSMDAAARRGTWS